MSSGVGGYAGQPYALNPLLLRGQAAAFNGQNSLTSQQQDFSNGNEVTNGNSNPQAAQNLKAGKPANPQMAQKAALLQEHGGQFQATVESMRMKIQLSGEMGNVHNNTGKQAEFLVSAFSEGQSFIDNLAGQFPDEATMPPEIRAMMEEISRLQDSCITLLNSALGTSFTKDEFRELIGAKKPGDGGGGEPGETQGQQPPGGDNPSGGVDGAQGDQGPQGAKSGAQDKLEETLRNLMGEARSLIAAAKANPATARDMAGKAMQKIQDAMLIIDVVETLRKAMQGAQPGGDSNSILGNPTSGAEALGAMNIGGANAGGANLGGGSSPASGGGIGGGSSGGVSLGSADAMSSLGGDASQQAGAAQQEAESLDTMRQELQLLAEEAVAAGADPAAQDPKKNKSQPAVTSVAFAPQATQAITPTGSLFGGNAPTFPMQPVFA